MTYPILTAIGETCEHDGELRAENERLRKEIGR